MFSIAIGCYLKNRKEQRTVTFAHLEDNKPRYKNGEELTPEGDQPKRVVKPIVSLNDSAAEPLEPISLDHEEVTED